MTEEQLEHLIRASGAILSTRQPTYPDAVITRLEKLEREVQALRRD